METIGERIVKPILKSGGGLLGYEAPPKKRVSIVEANNVVEETYSCEDYDRTREMPSDSTVKFMNAMNVLRIIQPTTHSPSSVTSEMVLTEGSYRSSSFQHQEESSKGNQFRVGEWADMFLTMGAC